MPEFFIVVPPGLEDELARELREIEPFLIGADGRPSLTGLGEWETELGGIRLQTEPLAALQLHFWLKTASRILLRLARFRATEFFQLESRLKNVQLKPWIGDQPAHLQVDAQKSKLGQEKRILEVAKKTWGPRIRNESPDTESLLLRAVSDEFTLSLDLTGEHLHKRGRDRELGGPAPIRETLAAALLRFTIHETGLSHLQNVSLVDPMAGSGTLLFEARDLYRPLASRSFAFQRQPWIPKILRSPSFLANDRSAPARIWKGLWAGDQAPRARERWPEDFHVLNSASEPPSGPVWVVANPPYGERLQALPPADLRDLLLGPNPERVGLILPKKKADELRPVWPSGWQARKTPVRNGGLDCVFLALQKMS